MINLVEDISSKTLPNNALDEQTPYRSSVASAERYWPEMKIRCCALFYEMTKQTQYKYKIKK